MGIETALIAGALIGAGSSGYQARKAEKAQRQATDQATTAAKATAEAATQANNRANQKRPDTGALLSANLTGAKGGNSGTLLTGPLGIDPNTLNLGKTTLLGGGG